MVATRIASVEAVAQCQRGERPESDVLKPALSEPALSELEIDEGMVVSRRQHDQGEQDAERQSKHWGGQARAECLDVGIAKQPLNGNDSGKNTQRKFLCSIEQPRRRCGE